MKPLTEFLRRNLVLILFACLLIGQLLTWRAVVDLANYLPRDPPRCAVHDPCMVQLDEYTLRQIRPAAR